MQGYNDQQPRGQLRPLNYHTTASTTTYDSSHSRRPLLIDNHLRGIFDIDMDEESRKSLYPHYSNRPVASKERAEYYQEILYISTSSLFGDCNKFPIHPRRYVVLRSITWSNTSIRPLYIDYLWLGIPPALSSKWRPPHNRHTGTRFPATQGCE
jgi:hypothetical protein